MTCNVAVTGATGFIGRALVARLAREDVEIRCVGRAPGHADATLPNVAYIDVSLTDSDAVEEALAGADVVYHLAGLGLRRFHEDPDFNVDSTRAVSAACSRSSRVRRLIHLSSIKAIGPSHPPRNGTDRSTSAPTDPYGDSKLRSEHALVEIVSTGHNAALRTSIVRAAAVYGPHDPNLSSLVRYARKWPVPNIAGSDLPGVAIVYIDDLCDYLCRLRTADLPPLSWHDVRDPARYTIADIFDALAAVGNCGRRRMTIPYRPLKATVLTVAKVIARVAPQSMLRHRLMDAFVHDWRNPDGVDARSWIHLQEGMQRVWHSFER